jgi:hypothetical protein
MTKAQAVAVDNHMTLCRGMWIGALTLVAVATGMLTSARSDEYPVLNVTPLCHGITDQSDLQEGFRSVSFDECMKAEQADREAMIKEWSKFSSDDKKHCIAEATMGGESSYTELITCLEMARDVRQLKTEPANSAPTQTAPAPRGHRQPRSY